LATGKLTALSFGVAADDWHVLQTARPNVLLIGPDAAVAGFLELLLPLLEPSVVEAREGRFALPTQPGGTIILRDVSRLDADSQQRLSEWLAEPERRTRIISTSTCPLYPFVERNAFSGTLYYTLNVIMLTLREPSENNWH
jgi:hypothetical protein